MRITDKDTADDVKYHLQRENPPEVKPFGKIPRKPGYCYSCLDRGETEFSINYCEMVTFKEIPDIQCGVDDYMRENPPGLQVLDGIENADKNTLSYLIEVMEHYSTPTRARDCTDFWELSTRMGGSSDDKIRVCKVRSPDCPHCFCENMIKFGECPKGIREM